MFRVTVSDNPNEDQFVTADDFLVTNTGALVFERFKRNRRAFAPETWLAVERHVELEVEEVAS